MVDYIRTALNPNWYHGRGKRAPFFEGWYYKLVNKAEDKRYAIIPGVYMHQSPYKTHSFIQVLDGMAVRSAYHQFPIFDATPNAFDVRIGGEGGLSRFSADHIQLNVDTELGQMTGELHFKNQKPWPVTPLSPGIMGWYGYLPDLETNHGVVSLDHEIEGELTINGETVDFTGGRGYIEKDWGRAFPDAYVWMQSNHFDKTGISLTASMSTLRGFLAPETGFIVGFLYKGTLHRFTTYSLGAIRHLKISDKLVEWELYNETHTLKIKAHRADAGILKGPERTDMAKRVDETMQGTVEVELIAHKGQVSLYKGIGRCLSLEVVGDTRRIEK